MSAKSSPSPESSNIPAAEDAPRVRRVANPRPKKPVAAAAEPAAMVAAPEERPPSQAPHTDWPAPDAPNPGPSGPSEHAKRKRRRKKSKGHGPQLQGAAQDEEIPLQAGHEPSAAPAPPSGPPRAKPDPDHLARFAWKIYLSEVSEEGVALVGDNDAKELARRCFRLAEIFMEEQVRRR
jgi:hypothetical protein